MAPGTVNNSAREVQAELAKLQADFGGTLTTGGTATAYTLTLTTAPAALTDGLSFWATANITSTGGATTLIVTPSGGAAFASKKIKTYAAGTEQDPTAGSLIAGQHYYFQYDSAADSAAGAYLLINPSSDGLVLIKSTTAAAASTIDFTSGLTGFTAFRLIAALYGSASASLGLRVSPNAGVSFYSSSGEYHWSAYSVDHTGVESVTASSTTGTYALIGAVGGASSTSFAGVVNAHIQNATAAVAYAHFISDCAWTDGSGFRKRTNTGGRANTGTGTFDALRVFATSGTLTGTVSLYGIREG